MYFLISQPKYVLDTQKNCINETLLFEHPNHMLGLIDKKIITFYAQIFLLSRPMCELAIWHAGNDAVYINSLICFEIYIIEI